MTFNDEQVSRGPAWKNSDNNVLSQSSSIILEFLLIKQSGGNTLKHGTKISSRAIISTDLIQLNISTFQG